MNTQNQKWCTKCQLSRVFSFAGNFQALISHKYKFGKYGKFYQSSLYNFNNRHEIHTRTATRTGFPEESQPQISLQTWHISLGIKKKKKKKKKKNSHTRTVYYCHDNKHISHMDTKSKSSVERQKGLTASHLHTQLDPFTSKLTTLRSKSQYFLLYTCSLKLFGCNSFYSESKS